MIHLLYDGDTDNAMGLLANQCIVRNGRSQFGRPREISKALRSVPTTCMCNVMTLLLVWRVAVMVQVDSDGSPQYENCGDEEPPVHRPR